MLQPVTGGHRPDVDCPHKFVVETVFTPDGNITSLERLVEPLHFTDTACQALVAHSTRVSAVTEMAARCTSRILNVWDMGQFSVKRLGQKRVFAVINHRPTARNSNLSATFCRIH